MDDEGFGIGEEEVKGEEYFNKYVLRRRDCSPVFIMRTGLKAVLPNNAVLQLGSLQAHGNYRAERMQGA